ncbi:hypothetical protein KSS87_010708 [Heliosperma pusillum]|nr:hypothetical protein KSS87_010708 [Heliosperma pusillum]
MDGMEGRVQAIGDAIPYGHEEEIAHLHRKIEELENTCATLMKARANNEKSLGVRKVKAPQPRTYNEARDSKVVDNFIFECGAILPGNRSRLEEDIEGSLLPENTEFVARKNLKDVKHTNSIRDYVTEFSSCMLEISNMSEKYRTFESINRLKRWAQQEGMRQNPRTLSAAIFAAE